MSREATKRLIKYSEDPKATAEAVAEVLDQGAAIEGNAPNGNPPLFNAAYCGNEAVVVLLLSRGAKVDQVNGLGCTALMGAAEKRHIKIVKVLLRHGADPGLRSTAHDRTAADYAGNTALAVFLNNQPKLHDENTIQIVREMPEGRMLRELYNFAARDRVSMLQKIGGPVECMTRETFAQIGDEHHVRKVFSIYARCGGKIPEDSVFGQQLDKKPVLRAPENKGAA